MLDIVYQEIMCGKLLFMCLVGYFDKIMCNPMMLPNHVAYFEL